MKPWEQLPGESSQAYRAARVYFEMGPERSLSGVARALRGGPKEDRSGTGKVSGTMRSWSAKYRWVERAQAYDQNLDAVGDRAREQERASQAAVLEQRRAQVAETEWKLSQALWLRIGQMLQHHPAQVTTQTTVSEDGRTTTIVHHHPNPNWRPRDVAALARAASDLQRLAAGMPTRAVVPSHQNSDAAPPVDQLQADADNRVPPDLAADWLDLAAGKALGHQGLAGARPADY